MGFNYLNIIFVYATNLKKPININKMLKHLLKRKKRV
jgi:hypothetical protein